MSLNRTGIEWTDFTWNSVTGCFNGCPYCYARDLAFGRLKKRYLANPHTLKFKRPGDPGKDPFWPRFWKDRLPDPGSVPRNFRSRNPHLPAGSAMIFTVDMGDLFGHWVPDTWRNEVLEVCEQYPKHIFQFLTKFPRELRGIEFPANSWVGTTVTRNSELDRIAALITNYSGFKYVSFEPLQDDIYPVPDQVDEMSYVGKDISRINWIIIGAETGKRKKKKFPEPEWVNNIIQVARYWKIPVFLKDNLYLSKGPKNSLVVYPGGKIQEFPIKKKLYPPATCFMSGLLW